MPNGSLSLADYPAAMVRLSCSKCGRSGQYRKAKLIEKYGADVPLLDLLHKIGASCPKMDALGNDPCGVLPDQANPHAWAISSAICRSIGNR
jgi:hypothetical protein